MLKLTSTMVANLLNLAVVTPGLLYHARAHLYQSKNGAPDPTPSDFLEAAFTGYPTNGNQLTWSDVRDFPDGGFGHTALTTFTGDSGVTAGDTVTCPVNGVYFTDTTNATCLGWAEFDDTIAMGGDGTFINLTINPELYTSMNSGDVIVS